MSDDAPVTDAGGNCNGNGDGDLRTRATVRTTHDRPGVVAAAVEPDNTDEMTTRVVDGRVETTIERETAGGLRATVDDYAVNLTVADRIARRATEHDDNDHENRETTDGTTHS